MNQFLSVHELPGGRLVTTPYLDGLSSGDDDENEQRRSIDFIEAMDDSSSSNSCELDLEALGEMKTKVKGFQFAM